MKVKMSIGIFLYGKIRFNTGNLFLSFAWNYLCSIRNDGSLIQFGFERPEYFKCNAWTTLLQPADDLFLRSLDTYLTIGSPGISSLRHARLFCSIGR